MVNSQILIAYHWRKIKKALKIKKILSMEGKVKQKFLNQMLTNAQNA